MQLKGITKFWLKPTNKRISESLKLSMSRNVFESRNSLLHSGKLIKSNLIATQEFNATRSYSSFSNKGRKSVQESQKSLNEFNNKRGSTEETLFDPKNTKKKMLVLRPKTKLTSKITLIII